jgi:uncharacterized membrane protein
MAAEYSLDIHLASSLFMLRCCSSRFIAARRSLRRHSQSPASYSPVAAGFALYAIAFYHVCAARVLPVHVRLASSLRRRQLSNYTYFAVELLIVIVSLAPCIVLLYVYRSLPDVIPIHWNLMAQPDSWARKGAFAVWFLSILGIYLQGFLLLLKHDFVGLRLILPAEHAEDFLAAKERLLRLSMLLMDWLRVGLALVLGAAALLPATTIDRFRNLAPILSVMLLCVNGVLIIGMTVLIVRWIRTNNDLNRRFGFALVQRKGELEHWRGGILYFNRDDPAFVLEKLDGAGLTINCGHPRALLYLAILLGLPLFAVLAQHSL